MEREGSEKLLTLDRLTDTAIAKSFRKYNLVSNRTNNSPHNWTEIVCILPYPVDDILSGDADSFWDVYRAESNEDYYHSLNRKNASIARHYGFKKVSILKWFGDIVSPECEYYYKFPREVLALAEHLPSAGLKNEAHAIIQEIDEEQERLAQEFGR